MNAKVIGMAVAGTAAVATGIAAKIVRSKKAKADEAMRLQKIDSLMTIIKEYIDDIERDANSIDATDVAGALSVAERMQCITNFLVAHINDANVGLSANETEDGIVVFDLASLDYDSDIKPVMIHLLNIESNISGMRKLDLDSDEYLLRYFKNRILAEVNDTKALMA